MTKEEGKKVTITKQVLQVGDSEGIILDKSIKKTLDIKKGDMVEATIKKI